MSLKTRWQGWRRQRRVKIGRKDEAPPLREFVYLDVVSVYSLIASRRGPIATDFTSTVSESLESELAGTVGANAGVAKSEVRSRLQSTQTSGSQVLRKSIVQTTFKELYELEERRLVVKPVPAEEPVPDLNGGGDVATMLGKLAPPWVVRSDELRRGRLIELEVELDAEPIFRVSTVVSTMLEIIRESPELAELAGYEQLGEIHSIGRVLEKMLAGLVPIRGEALDYKVASVSGEHWLIHSKVLEQLQSAAEMSWHPLNVVGVAEEPLFWKDIRRVLFSSSHYRVLGRIGRTGLQTTWRAVKLSDVFREVVPDLATSLDVFTETAATLGPAITEDQSRERQVASLRSAILDFSQLLADRQAQNVDESRVFELAPERAIQGSIDGGLKARRELFREVSRRLAEDWGIELDPVDVAHLRAAALLDSGVGLESRMPWTQAVSSSEPQPAGFLDVELVAIYW